MYKELKIAMVGVAVIAFACAAVVALVDDNLCFENPEQQGDITTREMSYSSNGCGSKTSFEEVAISNITYLGARYLSMFDNRVFDTLRVQDTIGSSTPN